MHVLADIPIACTQVEPPVIVGIRWAAIVLKPLPENGQLCITTF